MVDLFQEQLDAALAFLRSRYVARNLGGAEDHPLGIDNWGDGQRHVDDPAVLPNPDRLVAFQPFPSLHAFDDVGFLTAQVRRNKHQDRLTDSLLGRVPKHALGSGIPAGDRAVQVLADDGVEGGIDNSGEKKFSGGVARHLEYSRRSHSRTYSRSSEAISTV